MGGQLGLRVLDAYWINGCELSLNVITAHTNLSHCRGYVAKQNV